MAGWLKREARKKKAKKGSRIICAYHNGPIRSGEEVHYWNHESICSRCWKRYVKTDPPLHPKLKPREWRGLFARLFNL